MVEKSVYKIRLPQFEGPFDLLLFFIERDELDVYDIPIHKITEDYLDYIQQLQEVNMEQASEFILFASTLIHIKTKMLLPRKELDESGQEIDPREELIDKLVAYKRFKEISGQLSVLENQRALSVARGNVEEELSQLGENLAEGTEIESISLFKLMKAFERAMRKLQERTSRLQHVVVKYNYTIDTQRKWLLTSLAQKKTAQFEDLFLVCDNRIHAIFNLLSLLELIQQKYLVIRVGEDRNNFVVLWNEEREDNSIPHKLKD